MIRTLVLSKVIAQATLLSKLPWLYHPHALPATFLYVFGAYFRLNYYHLLGSAEFESFFFILIVSLHALLFLPVECVFKSKESDVFKASYILIVPEENNGSGAICPLEKQFFSDKVNSEKKRFEKLDYLHHQSHGMDFYKKFSGLKKPDLEPLNNKYGANKFDVPIPTFMELLQEHLVAPFFVFQIFCVVLWMLDDMWYFSLFTLTMLFVFESTMVFQRLKNLQEFRSMSIAPYAINVYRSKQWISVQTDQLLPGDLCSVVRQKDENPIPADLVLINGTCIANEAMLSGESTPQLKEPIQLREDEDILKISDDKAHILFGGTKILQVSADTTCAIKTPDGGCLAVVLRTGFATQQGKLVRTIIYSTERVTANNAESLFFILFLLVFAVIAAWYVWTNGVRIDDRDKTKLLLHCIMIITSVVPPELPMELSMAVNNSVAMLAKGYVYCTEPFRIPFAGRIDVACFDKTGTLTAENLVVEGVTGINESMDDLLQPDALPQATAHTLAAAHALVMLDDGVIGDPMEKNTLDSIKWHINKGDRIKPDDPKNNHSLLIIRRFPFSSQLKRMSTISYLHQKSEKKIFVACKGAPETLKSMFQKVPKDYDEHYKYWARRGKRVLALGYKILPEQTLTEIRDIHRVNIESELIFAGFLIFYCPLKSDSVEAIQMLNDSSHRTVMITGDNALTACHIAGEVEIVKRNVLIADIWDDKLEWKTVDEKVVIPIDLEQSKIPKEIVKYDLCCTGSALAKFAGTPLFKNLLPRLWVYARVSPSQKEFILSELKNAGYCTLMCGDGTNDVGALKQAHVGIALLDGTIEDVERIAAHNLALQKKMILEKQEELKRRWGAPIDGQVQKPGQAPTISSQMQQLMAELDDGDVPTIKFGDASVAAPFTSKVSSVMSVCNIISQGRATLVALTQMYKILALNSLTLAYSLSVMHLAGIKQGDWQNTVAGLMLTGLSKSTPVKKLSVERPQPNIFNFYIILSVLGQTAVHVASLIYIQREALFYSKESNEILPVDAPFKANLLNSGVYLVSLIMQISTFAINYQGQPFRESITKNKSMINSLVIVFIIAFAAASEYSEELNNTMQLVPFPDEFRTKLLTCMALDFSLAWGIEYVCWYCFSNNKPQKSLFPKRA
ncbi:hypothetical protein HDV02_002451 [Globomyces sp. JEL0801]|nr:hypothetical protein HDV02_002451 [Globomyces sp. JEL0801]